MKIEKTSSSIFNDDMPDPHVLATLVESLKMSVKNEESNISKEVKILISNLPSPRVVSSSMSNEELKIIFKTIDYIWLKLTGSTFTNTLASEASENKFLGSYWMLRNGIILDGINHYDIIKRNSFFVITLLVLNGFTLQHYLHQPPERLIFYIIMNGGIRMMVEKSNRAFFQMSEETYAKWGKRKIKGLDFKSKIVRILDPNVEYTGWKTGIPIKL